MPDTAKLLAAIEAEESVAFGRDNDELTYARSKAVDYYYGRPLGNEVEGRSKVVSRDVADTIEWMKPSLIRIFTAGDDVAQFSPEGQEDVEQAQQETDYVNYIVQQKNNWFPFIYSWITDALMTRNAYAMAYWEDDVQTSLETYQGITDDQLALIGQDTDCQIEQHSARQETLMGPQGAVPVVLHDVAVRKIKNKGSVKITVLPPERCLVSERCKDMSVREAPFFEYWEQKTISDLRQMGLDVPDDINDDGNPITTSLDIARDIGRVYTDEGRGNDADPSMRLVRVRMVWIRHDYNKDGIAECLQCILVGSNILRMDEVDGIPVASIVPVMMPHRHVGLSVFDMVNDIQEIKTALLRGTLDNIYLANNGRYGVSSRVNLDDMLTSRPGGIVRVDGSPSAEIFPFQHPNIIGQAIQTTEYFDQIRQNRTGTSQYFTGVDQNALNKTASGIAQLTSAASQRVELIARVIADGVRELFLVVHELTLKHSRVQEVVRLRNKWVTVDPRQWKRRSDMAVSVGLGVGNKEQLMANLQMILKIQGSAIQLGICTPENIRQTCIELTKAAGFPSAEKFWAAETQQQPNGPDPAMVEAQAKVAMHEKELQVKMAMNQQDNATKLQTERERNAANMQQARFEKGIDLMKDTLFPTEPSVA